MGIFKKYTIDELNKKNEEHWKKQKLRRMKGYYDPYLNPKSIHLDNGHESLIHLKYGRFQKIEIRHFEREEKRAEFYPIISKSVDGHIKENMVYLKIHVSHAKNSNVQWIKPEGNYDVYDRFNDGYGLTVSLNYPEKILMHGIIKVLREKFHFGCLDGEYTTHCHLDAVHPTDDESKIIFSKVTETLREFLNSEEYHQFRKKYS